MRELKEQLQILKGEGYERAVSALNEDERRRCEELGMMVATVCGCNGRGCSITTVVHAKSIDGR